MPMLDAGFIAMDPMVTDVFSVVRRTVSVDSHGRASVPAPQTIANCYGTVTIDKPDELVRTEAGEMIPRTIIVVTRQQLRGAHYGS